MDKETNFPINSYVLAEYELGRKPDKYTWNKDHPNYEKPAWLNRNKAKN